jgi:hypothetical protein
MVPDEAHGIGRPQRIRLSGRPGVAEDLVNLEFRVSQRC